MAARRQTAVDHDVSTRDAAGIFACEEHRQPTDFRGLDEATSRILRSQLRS